MLKNTIGLAKKKMEFVAKVSPQGDKVIIIVPKLHHDSIKKFKNPLHVVVEEIIE